MNLEIRRETIEDRVVVFLTGEIDAYTAPRLREDLTSLVESGQKHLIVDMTNVSYIDSTGLGIFVGVLKLTDANDGTLVLKNMSDRVFRLFSITGLDEVIKIDKDEGEEV